MPFKQHRTLMERFIENVCVDESNDNCWNWKGPSYPNGRGRLCVNGKERMAYRISWELAYGEIPKGMHVCHKCDNPSCVKPSHLFIGTPQDNLADTREKGREARGFCVRHTQLSEEDAKQICFSTTPAKQVAEQYNVSANYVYILRSQFRRYGKVRSKKWQPE